MRFAGGEKGGRGRGNGVQGDGAMAEGETGGRRRLRKVGRGVLYSIA